MKRKRIMVIGPAGCGKTTLVNALNNTAGPLRKTPDLIYGPFTMDVPASYLENAWMYKHIIAASQDASHILLLVDQSHCREVYSPGFARVFRCPVLGVISKCDKNKKNEECCIRQLQAIGVQPPYYKVSVPNGIGIEQLKADLQRQIEEKGGEYEIHHRK